MKRLFLIFTFAHRAKRVRFLQITVMMCLFGVANGQNTAVKPNFDTTILCNDDMMRQKNIILRINRIKGRAAIMVNGQKVATHCNEFVPFVCDIKPMLRMGKNKILLDFDTLLKDTVGFTNRYSVLNDTPRVLIRMAQYNFGWDFCKEDLSPSFSGFEITERDVDTLNQYYVTTDSIKNDTAFLTLHTQRKKTQFQIAHPQLWYPNTMGQSFIYDMQIGGRQIQFGIRTIELVTEADSIGESFYFKVNGKPLFIRGSNWIALERTDTLQLAAAKEANMNMLRLWGGGRYADDVLLAWCDRNGILIWQDFPFACAPYPADSTFLSEVSAEAMFNLNRIKRHPCLAILCGNNEIWEGIHNWNWFDGSLDSISVMKNYMRLFNVLLPQIISQTCPHIPYIHTSPAYGWGRPQSLTHGDCHYWGVWWADSCFETYTRKVGRFMSEYGFQSPPLDSAFWHISAGDGFVKNQFHPRGFEIIDNQIRDWYGEMAEDDYISKANDVASAAYRIAIEAHRRAKPYCMGSLTWQFNEPATAFSWACLDADGSRRRVYKTIKQCFEPLILSIDTYSCDDSVRIWYCNDLFENFDVPYLNLMFFDESEQMTFARSIPSLRFEQNRSQCLISLAYKDIPEFDRTKTFLRVSASLQGKHILATAFFCKPKHYVNPSLYRRVAFD